MPRTPAHTARLAETTELIVLDPSTGPVPRAVADVALGDEVLVTADGRICFRRVLGADEAPPPEPAVLVAAGGLSPDMPAHPLVIDSRQRIGLRKLPGVVAMASTLPGTVPHLAGGFWVNLTVEGAERIIAENIAIATGPLEEVTIAPPKAASPKAAPPQSVQPVPSAPVEAPPAPVAPEVPTILRAYNGPTEIALVSASTEGALTTLRFNLPPRTTTLRLASPSVQPPGDGRRLGVAVLRLVVDATEIPLDSPALVRGFHRAEADQSMAWRWTDGEALLILPPRPTPQSLFIHITDWHLRLHGT